MPDRSGTTQDEVLRTLVDRLVGAYHPERVYLFGSRARGAAGADSDYDLSLVVPDDAEPVRRRSRLAYQVLRGTGWLPTCSCGRAVSSMVACTCGRRSQPRSSGRAGSSMPSPDPLLLADTRAWLARAAEDLRAADHEFKATPPLLTDI